MKIKQARCVVVVPLLGEPRNSVMCKFFNVTFNYINAVDVLFT